MEKFYLPFTSGFQEFTDSFWLDEGGFLTGITVLIIFSFFTPLVYYKSFDKIKYANIKTWFNFLLLSTVLTFVVTLGLVFWSSDGYLEPREIIIFSAINGFLYSSLFYLFFSLMLNNLATNSKFIPFNLFNKN